MELLPLSLREQVWDVIAEILEKVPDLNTRAVIIQRYISEGGPVPNSRGEKIRAFLKPNESVGS
jgi:hypothetical protein